MKILKSNRIDKTSLHADWAKNMLVTKTEEMLHITFKQSDSNEQKPTNLKV